MIDRLLRLRQVCDQVGLGPTRIYALIKEGKFPKPVHPYGSVSRWPESAVQAWIADVKAEQKAS